MATISALQAGYLGVQRGLIDAQRAAEQIAGPDAAGNLDQLTEASVALLAAELQVEASAAVIAAGSDTIGTLIDVFA